MCMCIYVHMCNCVHILNQKTKQMSSRGASPLKKWHLMHVCGNSRSIIDFKHFLKMYNYILPNNVCQYFLKLTKVIKGHLLNEIRFSETVPRIPIVVSQPSVFQLSVFFFWEMKLYLWGGENAFVFSFYFPIWGQAHLSVSQDTETVEIDKRVSWWKSDCDVISVICNHWNQNQCDQWRDHCDQNANQLMLSFNWKEIGDRIFINVVSSLGCIKSSPWSLHLEEIWPWINHCCD